MRCSLNEIEMTLRKAGRGAGFPFGLAEDVAAAAAWLCANDRDGTGAALAALAAGYRPRPECTFARNAITFAATPVASVGPSVVDLLIAGGGRTKVRVSDIDAPLLLVGLAGSTAVASLADMRLEFDGGQAVEISAAGGIKGSTDDLSAAATLGCNMREGVRDRPVVPIGGVEVNKAIWAEITALARKTYVPESATSLQGAGAGLTDND